MVALRGFGWPHDASTTRSRIPQSVPTSPVVKPSSIGRLIKKVQQRASESRLSSEAHCPQLPAFRTLSPICASLQSNSPKPIPFTSGGSNEEINEENDGMVRDQPSTIIPGGGLDGAGFEDESRPFSISYDILGLNESEANGDAMAVVNANSQQDNMNTSAIEDLQELSDRSDEPSSIDSQSSSKEDINKLAVEELQISTQSNAQSNTELTTASKTSLIESTTDDPQKAEAQIEAQVEASSDIESSGLSTISIPWNALNSGTQTSSETPSSGTSAGLSDVNEEEAQRSPSSDTLREHEEIASHQPNEPVITSLEFSGDGTRGSFNALVLDLLQDEPDFPIGGSKAAPMAPKSSANSKIVTKQSTKTLDVKRLQSKIPKAREPSKSGGTIGKGKRITSKPSISSDELVGTENRPMFTAPETPINQRSEEDDTKQHQAEEVRKSKSEAPESTRNDSSWRKSFTVIPPDLTTDVNIEPEPVVGPKSPAPSQGDAAGDPLTDAAPAPIDADAPVEETGVEPGEAGAAPLDIPTDATGQLPPPEVPDIKPKRNVGKIAVRKCRAAVLSKHVLVLLVGRQLAGPTATALALISDGVPIDPTEVTGVAQAPVPVAAPA